MPTKVSLRLAMMNFSLGGGASGPLIKRMGTVVTFSGATVTRILEKVVSDKASRRAVFGSLPPKGKVRASICCGARIAPGVRLVRRAEAKAANRTSST